MIVEMPPRQSFSEYREEKMMGSLSPALNVMITAVKKAGRKIIRDFGEVENLQVSNKSPKEFIAKTIEKSETALMDYLKMARPRYNFTISNDKHIEGEDSSNLFLIEPLDGVVNFMHSIPLFSISIALVRDKDLLAGVVYNPVLDELFYAEKGTGTYLMTGNGDKRLRVSGRNSLNEALIGVDFTHQDVTEIEQYQTKLRFLIENTMGARHLGAASLGFAYTAAGRLDAHWCRFVKPCSAAAGLLLVKEAGGYVRTLTGTEKPIEVIYGESILSTNHNLDAQITKALRS